MTKIKGYLGIDVGTQGLTALLTDEAMKVIESGSGHYEMVPGLAVGCYEQAPQDWERAAAAAMNDLRKKLAARGLECEVLAIGISGQMHGEVLCDAAGNPLAHARLWCDSRNEAEGSELTDALGVKMPKRITAARYLWSTRQRPEVARRARHLTTPGGWLAFRLTGQWRLGIGDASGMFPIGEQSSHYDVDKLTKFQAIVGTDFPALADLLPEVCVAGQDGGALNEHGAGILGLPIGIPVAPAEGDQPAAMAGSLIGSPGVVSMSFGTSVCANAVGDKPFVGVARSIDHFCAADGKPINMVWLRNGTTFMNSVVEMFGGIASESKEAAFAALMPRAVAADDDCGGLLAFPFMDDEPGLGVEQGGQAAFWGLNQANATPGNAIKAAILATMFNLRLGSLPLEEQRFPRDEIVLSGGLTKTPHLGQLLANVFDTPVVVFDSSSEGSAWGAALLAGYRRAMMEGSRKPWADYLASYRGGGEVRFVPNPEKVNALAGNFQRYRALFDRVIHRR